MRAIRYFHAATFVASLFLVMSLTVPPGAAEDLEVNIGVRIDAGPFARFDRDTRNFRGYLVDLCTEATTRAGFTYHLKPVSAAQRLKILNGNLSVTAEAPWKLDLLCDPTTISLQRLEDLAKDTVESLAFSQIVFVANSSYVERKSKIERSRAEYRKRNKPECFPGRGTEMVYFAGFVEGATSKTIIEREARSVSDLDICLVPFPAHVSAVRALCESREDKLQYSIDFYFGDLDIIRFYRAQVLEDNQSCELQEPKKILSYEPYAFLVSNAAHPGFRPNFIAALYEMFSDGTAAQRFASHFEGAGKSTALNLLFRINSVPGLRDGATQQPAARSGP